MITPLSPSFRSKNLSAISTIHLPDDMDGYGWYHGYYHLVDMRKIDDNCCVFSFSVFFSFSVRTDPNSQIVNCQSDTISCLKRGSLINFDQENGPQSQKIGYQYIYQWNQLIESAFEKITCHVASGGFLQPTLVWLVSFGLFTNPHKKVLVDRP